MDHTVSMLLAARHSTRSTSSANLEGHLSIQTGPLHRNCAILLTRLGSRSRAETLFLRTTPLLRALLTALADLLFSPEEEFEGALGAMADTWSWQSLVQWVSPLLAVVLTFSLPRLFQRELRRLQLESETRVKRLEALEKAISLVGKAKSELRIKVTTDELQNKLRRILHEFAGPIVLSREALEDWLGANGGRHIHGVTAQLIPPFSSGPVPTQTSFDNWKVASEQDQQQ
jgi:hypothetical protein